MNIFALVIDDEPEPVKRKLSRVNACLMEHGHTFEYNIQQDITSACETFTDWKNIDLIWLDLIGVIGGINLLEGLKKEIPIIRTANRLVPILVVSKQTDPDIIIQAVDLGVSSYVIATSLPTGALPVFSGDKEADRTRLKPLVDKIMRLVELYRPIKRYYRDPRSFGIFRKTGDKKESEAVERQFRFLEEVMQYDDLRGLFPDIVGSPDERESSFSYETTYFEMPTLRSVLFGMKDQGEMLTFGEKVLERVLDQLFRRLYVKKVARPEDQFVNVWVRDKYARRLKETKALLAELRKNAETVDTILAELRSYEKLEAFLPFSPRQVQMADLQQVDWLLSAQSVRLDLSPTVWREPAQILTELAAQPEFLDKVTPPRVSWIHGDLHLGNILVDYPHPEIIHVKLIDPGGYLQGHDPAYDIGKLLHSFHGEYDFIHEGYLTIKCLAPEPNGTSLISGGFDFIEWNTVPLKEGGSGDISETLKKQVSGGHRYVFAQLAQKVEELINDKAYFSDDPHWRLRAHFYEAMHFCTMAKFHLKEDPKRTATIILRGIQLINEFYSDYKNGLFDKN